MNGDDSHPDRIAARLAAALGTVVGVDGQRLRLHDLLREEGVLVLQRLDAPPETQADQHGDPRRRTAALMTVPLPKAGDALHPLLAALLGQIA